MNSCADLELSLRRSAEGLTAELRFIPAGSSAPVTLLAGDPPLVALDEAVLQAAHADLLGYGEQLSQMLWADPRLAQALGQARALASGAGAALRLRLLLDEREPALHAIYWESLGDPSSPGQPLLAVSERLRFSRFLGSSDLQALRPRPRAELRALLVIASPEDLDAYQLDPIDGPAELARASAALAGVPLSVLASAGQGGQATLNAIVQALRDGPDILYLVAHGTLHRGAPYLWLEDDEGLAVRVGAKALVEQIQALSSRPLLVVLGSCQSAGNGATVGALNALGPLLAASGIAAVVAMQGNVAQEAVGRFMQPFFHELLRDGAVDRAAAAGRAALVASAEWWQPVLWMRVTDGQLWRDPQATPATAPALPAERPTNLPTYATQLLGREGDVAALTGLLLQDTVRLVTLLGPGGIGKTRLAVQAGWELRDDFAHGVFFADLTALSTAQQVLPTIAAALDIKEDASQPLTQTLGDYLRSRQLLLILDTFEHMLEAAPLVGRLLSAAPELRLIVTSRAALRIGGEYEYPVDPLALPDLSKLPLRGADRVVALAANPAIALFIERANAVRPGFAISEANAHLLAKICDQLDGLPLAIELAAVRIKLLTPPTLLARLGNRLGLLTGGSRDLAAHQQTIRSTIAWSYDMLEPMEQRLFARLAIFVGGATFSAIEAICRAAEPGADLLDPLSSLVDKSLLRQSDSEADEPRFGMLATIREYAAELLAAAGEVEALKEAHASFYLDLAQEARRTIQGTGQKLALEQLEREHENLRAALEWAISRLDAERAGALGDALYPFWYIRGFIREGRGWLTRIIALGESIPAPTRAQVCYGAGVLAMAQADYSEAREQLTASLVLYRALGAQQREIGVLQNLGNIARRQGDREQAGVYYTAALDLCRAIEAHELLPNLLTSLAAVRYELGDLEQAASYSRESLARARAAGRQRDVAYALNTLWLIALQRGQLGEVSQLLAEGQAIYSNLQDQAGIAAANEASGRLALAEGQLKHAEAHLRDSLKIWHALGERRKTAFSLEWFAVLAQQRSDHLGATRLWGFASALRQALSVPLAPVDLPPYEKAVAEARTALGESAFAAAWASGAALSVEEAVSAALR